MTMQAIGCDTTFNALERTVSVTPERLKMVTEAAMNPVMNRIDELCADAVRYNTFNALNPTLAAPNTAALAVAAATAVNQRLDEMGTPKSSDGKRSMALNPALNANFVTGTSGLFNNQTKIGDQYDSGMMVNALGLKFFMDQNVAVHTNGAGTASNINGANQTGATITVAATGAGTITRGTRITLPGVNAVNPVSRRSTGQLAQFIVTADVPQGATSIPISPAIVTSGAFQNVTASPTTGQPFVIFANASTSYGCSVGYHQDAFTLACVPFVPFAKNTGVDQYTASDNGLSVTVTQGTDLINFQQIQRIDVLIAVAPTYPELSCIYAN